MRKIVIAPIFASAHLLDMWIKNINDVLCPYHIILVEGFFPLGPENKGFHDKQGFLEKYCKVNQKDDIVGFDWETTVQIASKHKNVQLKSVDYCGISDVNDAFIYACQQFNFQIGDIIFPLEPDAFLLESDAYLIHKEVSQLQVGQGISCEWKDFLGNQYYTEGVNMKSPKYRRFAYKFDCMENYSQHINAFTTQNYQHLKKVDTFFVRHYCWFVQGIYKELRFDMIKRKDSYWNEFSDGLDEIHYNALKGIRDKVIVRPSRQDDSRFAVHINCKHPKHIQKHPCYV